MKKLEGLTKSQQIEVLEKFHRGDDPVCDACGGGEEMSKWWIQHPADLLRWHAGCYPYEQPSLKAHNRARGRLQPS